MQYKLFKYWDMYECEELTSFELLKKMVKTYKNNYVELNY